MRDVAELHLSSSQLKQSRDFKSFWSANWMALAIAWQELIGPVDTLHPLAINSLSSLSKKKKNALAKRQSDSSIHGL